MLDLENIKKIEEFVSKKPRSIQEISGLIKKNWRTADRYVEYIKENFGTISTVTFRKGTRGALKIVYWSSIENIKSNVFQKKLEEQIRLFKKKEEFSAFDIYQHVSNENKTIVLEKVDSEYKTDLIKLSQILKQTKKQILIFSGNLSWTNLKNDKVNVFEDLRSLVKNGVKLKVLCRVNLDSMNNINNLLSLNFKYGKDLVEVRHSEQPLRALVIDNNLISIKEILEPTGKINELADRMLLFYTIKDKEWVEWMSKLFWNMFSESVDSKRRLEQIKNLV